MMLTFVCKRKSGVDLDVSLFLFLSRHSNFACLNMNQVLFGIVTLRSRCTNCILYSLHHFALETLSLWFVHISGRELKFIDYYLSYLSSNWWDDFGTPGSNSWLPCSQIFPVKIQHFWDIHYIRFGFFT